MKKITAILLAISLGTATLGCIKETEFGKCIGVTEDKETSLVYKPSTWNIFLGVIFVETIIVPLVVIVDEFQCPVKRK